LQFVPVAEINPHWAQVSMALQLFNMMDFTHKVAQHL